jgi:cysteinyl-tRNA synthetase
MSGVEEEFKPISRNRVNIFVCGPTVYDYSHIGHARTYVAYDVIVRYLKFKGYSTFYLMNITDVDDKIIERSKERNTPPLTLSEEYTRAFYCDMAMLNISSINLFAKASEHIPEMINQITRLLEGGYAYRVDGDIYFDISKFQDYGRLSHQNPDELKKHRIEPDPRKRNPSDFSLWKSRSRDELGWESPWGWGRPGWHIEDTAITATYFGPQYDIHGGAIELVFPHHEAEIAQAESASGKRPMVKYWIHTGMVNVRGQKMSKSLGNFVTIRDVLKKYSPNVLRIFFISSHYRSPIDYNEANLENAHEGLRRIVSAYVKAARALRDAKTAEDQNDLEFSEVTAESRRRFMEAMDDDFNTPVALSVMLSYSRRLETYANLRPAKRRLQEGLDVLRDFSSIIGIDLSEAWVERPEIIDELIRLIVDLRDEARKRSDWATADKIRERLASLKISLEDEPEGTRWEMMI